MRMINLSWFLLACVSLFLAGQAFRLQVIQGKEQAQRAEQNRFRIKTLEAHRGVFYDMKGSPLVEETPSGRRYLMGEELAHVLGYVGEANADELVLFGVEPGILVGKSGLEYEENGLIRGIDGGVVEEFGADGEKIRTFSQTAAKPGRNIQLTINQKLQHIAYQALKDSSYKGVVVASSLDGRLLAMAIYPSFDPNVFVPKPTPEETEKAQELIAQLLTDTNTPMFNRAIAGLYPPASTFKIVTALAALENKVIDGSTQVEDTGEIRIGSFSYGNWYFRQYGRTDGMVDLVKALQRSNDIYFYKIGGDTGIQNISMWAQNLGFGRTTGIPLPGEAKGLVPTVEWKEKTLHDSWYLGDTYITSIGQGNLQVTPLQVHMMTTSIANEGWLCRPDLIGAVVDDPNRDLHITDSFEQARCKKLSIQPKNIQLVKEGLKAACAPRGTGWPLFNFKVSNPGIELDGINFTKEASGSAQMVGIPVACKTGTAEIGIAQNHGKLDQKTHAWFTAFAPIEKPEIVVTVLLEEAGQGSDKAAPVAREILKEYFESK